MAACVAYAVAHQKQPQYLGGMAALASAAIAGIGNGTIMGEKLAAGETKLIGGGHK
jgi:hypothetical protein